VDIRYDDRVSPADLDRIDQPAPRAAVSPRGLGRALLIAAIATGAIVGGRGITSEASVSLQGDMARYLMDGVFLKDFLTSGAMWPIHDLLPWAQHYYVRYPALSLGHHPPLLPVSLVPFFSVFGVSVAAGRLDVLACFILAVILLFTLTRRLYDEATAGWACLLFASSPFVGWYGQRVLSEMPAIMLVLASMNFAVRFRDHGRARDYFLLIVMSTLSLATRQLAAFVYPAYVFVILHDGGWRRMRQPVILGWTIAGGVVFLAIAVATLLLSPFNVSIVVMMFTHSLDLARAADVFDVIARKQLGPALLGMSVAGILAWVLARDRRFLVVIVWIVSVVGGVLLFTGNAEPDRYSAFAVPAYCIAGATLWMRSRREWVRVISGVVLISVCVWQLVLGRDVRPEGAGGYEEAARFVLDQQAAGPTVLYGGSVDTGYFVFFVRKHDAARRLVVLRSDKILTTSLMSHLAVEDRIADPAEIYGILRRFGTRFVVIEDRPTGSVVLDWLHSELRTSHFAERRRFPTGSRDPRLAGVDVVVYEYLEATPPDPAAEIDVRLPLVGREFRMPLSDFTRPSAP
jgi:hypothetical protein